MHMLRHESEPHLRIIAEYLFGEFPFAKIKDWEIKIYITAAEAESESES